MKKRFIAIISAALIAVSIPVTAMGAQVASPGFGSCGGGYSIMRDADGNFLSLEAFEANLNKAIEAGLIKAEDKQFYLDRYEYCTTNGGGLTGGGCGLMGGGRGRGRGMFYTVPTN